MVLHVAYSTCTAHFVSFTVTLFNVRMTTADDSWTCWLTLQRRITRLQDGLNFKGCTGGHFVKNGMGKICIASSALGIVGGVHLGVLIALCTIPSDGISPGFLSTLV